MTGINTLIRFSNLFIKTFLYSILNIFMLFLIGWQTIPVNGPLMIVALKDLVNYSVLLLLHHN